MAALALLLLMAHVSLAAAWTPVGDLGRGKAVADGVEYHGTQGQLRITVLQPGLIRVRYTPAPSFAVDRSYAVVPQPQVKVPFNFALLPNRDELRTAELTVQIFHHPFRLRFLDGQGRLLEQDSSTGALEYNADGSIRDTRTLDQDTHLFGFGEKTGHLDKRGQKLGGYSMTMWNSDVYGYDDSIDPLYVDIPFYLAIRDGIAYGVFFDNTWRTNFDVGHDNPNQFIYTTAGGDLNYYVLAGPTPQEVLARYRELTGAMAMPPLWVLGYNQSRYSYYPDKRVREIAQGFRSRHIPLDVLWFDIHYMRGYRDFTWDPQRFPNPQGLLSDLQHERIHSVAILDPGVKVDPDYGVFKDGTQADIFVKHPNGKPFVGPVWPGDAEFPDFTDRKGRAWWAHQVAHFAAVGLSGLWVDMNEPSVFNVASGTMPDDIVFHHDGQAISQAEVHNVFGQQMSRATREGLLELRPEVRPFVLSRDSYAGGQRYAAVWTGDNLADWAHLRDGLTTLLGMGISGFPFVGNDIGGFGGIGNAQLWTRWVEVGTFFPFMRAHANVAAPEKEPWSYGPLYEAANRRAIERRYQFLPTIYNAFHQTAQTGMPVMRALMLQYPDDAATYDLSDEFLFGDDLLVAPVLDADMTSRDVYLPKGLWYQLRDRGPVTRFQGGQSVSVHAALDQIPLFVRDGAILFKATVMQSTAEWPTAPLTFEVFASQQPTSRTYYEDDGASFAFQHGVFFQRTITVTPGAEQTVVDLSAAMGSYQPRHPSNRLLLHFAHAPHAVDVNGQALAASQVRFDPATATLAITVPQTAAALRAIIHW